MMAIMQDQANSRCHLSTRSRSTSSPSSRCESSQLTVVRLIEPRESEHHVRAFADAVRAGLVSVPRTLPWSYFYDESGSRLFDLICELPEYYLTRVEDSILRRHAQEMIAHLAGDPDKEPTLIELGSGSARKTQRLITAGLDTYGRLHYVPIDVSPSALEESARRLARRFHGLRISGYVADYRRGLERIIARGRAPA